MKPTALSTPSALHGLDDIADLAAHLRRIRAEVADQVRAGAGGVEVALRYSDGVDALLRRMLELACRNAGGGADAESIPIAVVATGGYGRRELCPHSDIDITFVPHRDGDPLVDRVIKEMFTLVMRVFIDENKIDVGYAYRLLDDCSRLDHQTTCGLLDARLIAGSSRLFIQFEDEFQFGFNHAEFIFTKLEERRKQLRDAAWTPRVVEPNVKTGAGGMRDLQTAVWLTQARAGLDAAQARGDRSFAALVKYAGVTPKEAERIAAAKEFLFRVRNALHVLAGEERDQLVITRQEQVATLLGYGPEGDDLLTAPNARRETPPDKRALDFAPPVERFMRDYYGHASTIRHLASRVMHQAERGRIFLGIGLDSVERRIEPASDALASEDPIWMLWVCEIAQRHDLELGDALAVAIQDLLQTRPPIADPERAADIFTHILASQRGAYPILQRMADLGVLAWVLPEVGGAMDLIPYDPSHDFTVGQHTLHVVRNLDALRRADVPDDLRDLRLLMLELAHPEQLYLAALLHDAGKAHHGRPHSEIGAELADAVCRRLHWEEMARANVVFLVRHHQLMDEVSRLRDLNLDETIRDFTSVVDDVDRLNMLYLLTYADTSAVGAGVWTQVKARFLRDLYRRAERALEAEDGEGYDDADLTRTRRRLLKELTAENLPREEVAAHVAGMPAPYILNTSLAEMTLHIGYVRRARQGQPVVDFVSDRESTFTEVTVCSLDDPQPGLLSKIAGVLYAGDLNVHSAQVFTRHAPAPEGAPHDAPERVTESIAIDTLYVDFRGRQLTPAKRKEIATNLTAVLLGQTTVEALLEKKRKPAGVGGQVDHLTLRNDLTEKYSIVEVTSADAQAALYRVSGALSSLGWHIVSAKVSQFRGKSVASFYVVGARKLGEARALAELRRVLPPRES